MDKLKHTVHELLYNVTHTFTIHTIQKSQKRTESNKTQKETQTHREGRERQKYNP